MYSTVLEVAYLLIYGDLPSQERLKEFIQLVEDNSLIHENMLNFFKGLPPSAHPMAILSSTINSLAIYYPNFYVDDSSPELFDLMVARLISTIRTIAAFTYIEINWRTARLPRSVAVVLLEFPQYDVLQAEPAARDRSGRRARA